MIMSKDEDKKKKRALSPLKEQMGLGEGSSMVSGQTPLAPDPAELSKTLLPPGVAAMALGQNSDVQEDMSRRFKNRQGETNGR